MASWMAALIFAVGASAWIYNIMMKQTGNNSKTSIILSGISFIFLLVLFWTILDFISGAL
jgi:hypothetical protein